MEREYEIKYHSLEENHWWFRARRDMIVRIVRNTYKHRPAILDVGCSGGILLKELEMYGYKDLYGIDVSKDAVRLCRKKGLKNVFLENTESTHFGNGEFDIIVCSDVLEHIKNQQKAVKEWKRILKPGGLIICFVPAFNLLWSSHDEANMHYRRYTKGELKAPFSYNGCSISKSAYWNFSSFVPILFFCLARISSKGNSRLETHGKTTNEILFKVLKIENILIMKNISFLPGLSAFVIASKSG